MTVCVSTVAKINLYLEVQGRRADGYHEIATVFLPLAAPVDVITVADGLPGELEVTCTHPGVPAGPDNLCWRAAAAFAQEAGLAPAWHLTIDKGIPVAAGLGGGSSDAAAVLAALNRGHGTPLSRQRLSGLAARLGADVPFFLEPVPALGRGIGDVLTPVPCACSFAMVLANPGFPISAAWAYAHRGRVPVSPAPSLDDLLGALAAGDVTAVSRLTFNALEPAVLDKFPLVAMVRDALLAAGCLCSHVSGSGPTVYGLCAPEAGPAICASLEEQFGPALWTCATHSTRPAPVSPQGSAP